MCTKAVPLSQLLSLNTQLHWGQSGSGTAHSQLPSRVQGCHLLHSLLCSLVVCGVGQKRIYSTEQRPVCKREDVKEFTQWNTLQRVSISFKVSPCLKITE